MSPATRMIVILSAATILAAVTPTANAAQQNVAPEPVLSCQDALEAHASALDEIHAAKRSATTTERRTLHLEFVELRRDPDLETSTC